MAYYKYRIYHISNVAEMRIRMTKFNDFLHEQLKDPEIKEEYDTLEPEFAIIQALIDARKQRGITQNELSERTGISQGDISKLENGNGNPSVRTHAHSEFTNPEPDKMVAIGSIDFSSEVCLYDDFKSTEMDEKLISLNNYFYFDDENHILWILWTQDDGREYNFAYRNS